MKINCGKPPEDLSRHLKRVSPLVWVLLLTVACLVPFLNKAFHMDDTLFLRAAEQTQKHPLDPFGFNINWFGTPRAMTEEFQNPPLTSYYIAAVATIFGWSEWALHLAFLLPALAVAWGTFSLARALHPLGPSHEVRQESAVIAAVVAVLTPVFLISATTVMCDVMLVAFWVWALVWFEKGMAGKSSTLQAPSSREAPNFNNQNDRTRRVELGSWSFSGAWSLELGAFIGSGLLAGLALMTKFTGLALVPLMVAYGFSRRRRAGMWLLSPLIPVLVAIGYQRITQHLYGKGLLLGAAAYSSEAHELVKIDFVAKGIHGLIFAGGCFLPVLFYGPWLWSGAGERSSTKAGEYGDGKSSKIQAPNTRETPTFKLQIWVIRVLRLRAWGFSGAWMLVLGTLRRLTSLKTQSIPFGIPPSALYRLVPVFCLLSAIAIFLLKPIFPDRVGNLIIFHHAEHWWLWFQVVLFMAGGIQILLLACSDWWQRREASSLLLVLWTLGIFIFASFVNWSLNARSFLPMVPALGILVARRVRGTKVGEWVSARGRGTEPKAPSYPLTHLLTFAFPAFVAGVVALCVAKADYDLAGAGRAAAARFCANYARPGAVLLFEGHWGFQYYMEKLGARALDLDYHKLMPDEMVVVPEPASGTRALPEELVEWIGTRQDVSSSPCSTMNPPAEAGFYSDFFGRLPFVFGVPQTASFALYKVIHPDDHALLQSVGQEEPIARIRRCRAALEAHPNDARLHFDLADAYVGQSMSSEAVAEYREGLRLKPDSPEALNNIAWILATDADPQLRNGSEAVRLAERACELAAWKTAQYVGTLAAAYAAAGRVQDAVVAADKAISLAEKAGQQDLAQRNRELREGYMRKQ